MLHEDFLTIADEYVVTATGVRRQLQGCRHRQPHRICPASPPTTPAATWRPSLRSGSYNYRFDWLALTNMGSPSPMTSPLADVIVGPRALNDEALGAVKAGTPYMGYTDTAVSRVRELVGLEISSCEMGTDFGRVVYPNTFSSTPPTSTSGDDVMYEYGTYWFTEIPWALLFWCRTPGRTLQGCICLTDDGLVEQFETYNNGCGGLRVSVRQHGHRSVCQCTEPQDSSDG